MTIFTSYDVRIPDRQFNKVFSDTVVKYRAAVSFFIDVRMHECSIFAGISDQHTQLRKMEQLTVKTNDNPNPKYDFGAECYKFPCYYRRAAIAEALGKVSSYESNLTNWENNRKGKRPGKPQAGYVYPALYRGNTFVQVDDQTAQIKVWIHNTWDWVTVPLRRTDVSYIQRLFRGIALTVKSVSQH